MKRMDQINVIPFIDIMLVLLAIVLTTATFIAEGRLQIRLPVADGTASVVPTAPLEIAIGPDGLIFFRGEALGPGASGLAALGPRLEGLARETPIVLRVDAQSRFEGFVGVLDRLKARGLDRVTILTRRP
jgi:biopolymer transport protein ExbD